MASLASRLEAVRQLPLHQALGLRSLQADAGEAELTFAADEPLLGPSGALHGGLLYVFCDVAAYAATLSLLTPDQDAVTHGLQVSVLRPVARGQSLTVSAQVQKRGRQLAFIQARVARDAKLVATASITKSLVPAATESR